MKIVSINNLKENDEVKVYLFGLPYEVLTVKELKLNSMYNSVEDFKVVLKNNENVKVSLRNSDMDKYKNLLSYIKKNRKMSAEELRHMEDSGDIDLSQLNAFHWEYIEDRRPIKDIKGDIVAEIVVRSTIKNIHKEKGNLVRLEDVIEEYWEDDELHDDGFSHIDDEFYEEGEYYMIELIKEVEFNIIRDHEIIASDSMYSINEVFLDSFESLCEFLNGNIGDIKVTMGVEANSKERVLEDLSNKNIKYIWED